MGTLTNVGNTCCINTFIQCIAHTPKLRDIFINMKTTESDLLNEIKDVLNIISDSKNNCVPKGLLNCIFKKFPDIIIPGHQHDLNEILTLIFDKINDKIGKNIELKHTENNIENKINVAKFHYNNKKISKLIKNIQSTQLSILNCNNCKYQQINIEVFSTLMLDINDKTDFNKIITNYFEKEKLDEWKCDKCKNKNSADKFIKLWEIPNILVIVLKRFKYTNEGYLKKITNVIEIPENITFCKGSVLKNENEEYSYNLMTIGNHVGLYEFGHYYAICKKDDGWYKYDDNICEKLEKLNCNDAYILFYQRI